LLKRKKKPRLDSPKPSKVTKIKVKPVELSERTLFTQDGVQPMVGEICDDEIGSLDWSKQLSHRQVR
jgi:hypothetical protein